MNENVLVTIRSDHILPGQKTGDEPIEVITAGTCAREGDDYLLYYTENFESDGNMNALNAVRIKADSLQVTKTGDVEVDMYFEEGKRSVAVYTTPFGILEMGISTNSLETCFAEDKIHTKVAYAININGARAADCLLEMRVEAL